MNSLEKYFRTLLKKGKKLFLPYVTFGDPDWESFLGILQTLENNGADAIEIGIPFSDPLADGPTIQRAYERALEKNFNLRLALNSLKRIKNKVSIPILFMSYYNPVFTLGEKEFFKLCQDNHLDGIIIPDLSLEEAEKFVEKARKIDLATVFFISPTTSVTRITKINKFSTGFIYYLSLTGVTGARENLAQDLIKNLKDVTSLVTKPLCVGFGISKPEQVRKIIRYADGVIIGSALVKIIESNLINKRAILKKIGKFSQEIRKVLDEKNFSS